MKQQYVIFCATEVNDDAQCSLVESHFKGFQRHCETFEARLNIIDVVPGERTGFIRIVVLVDCDAGKDFTYSGAKVFPKLIPESSFCSALTLQHSENRKIASDSTHWYRAIHNTTGISITCRTLGSLENCRREAIAFVWSYLKFLNPMLSYEIQVKSPLVVKHCPHCHRPLRHHFTKPRLKPLPNKH